VDAGVENHRSKEHIMGSEDVAAGRVKQVRGKANDIAGAVKGNVGQQIKGKVQKAVGDAQVAMGKGSSKRSNKNS
jgi:uncharacterized protein YjbJ (UPF0337 family)